MCKAIGKVLGLAPPKAPKPVVLAPPPAPAAPRKDLQRVPVIGDMRRSNNESPSVSAVSVRSGINLPAATRSGLQIGGYGG